MKYQQITAPPQSRTLKSGRVSLEPGQEVGEHKTDAREEVIVCVKGNPTLVIGNEEIALSQGDAVFIKEETFHNVINKTDAEAEYVYVVHKFGQSLAAKR